MLNKKINNFDDFSDYYSEENQLLLAKKSKFRSYLILLLLIVLVAYLSHKHTIHSKQSKSLNTLDPKILTETSTSTTPNIIYTEQKLSVSTH
jgi:hypothetical protein